VDPLERALGREDSLDSGRRVLAALVLDREVLELVLQRVRDVDVADRPGRLETAPATPELPLAPLPEGQLTATLLPICDFQAGLAPER
jgi:hypothetical protein